GQIIAIDGKTLRRSYDRASGKSAIHMVSAWASANHISLGQVVVDEKSNEITAIPKLLQMLEIKGSLVTIDAMGCPVKIAETIVDQQANYVLAVKGNQPTLHDGVVSHFAVHLSDGNVFKGRGFHRTNEKAHGRETEREYFVCSVPDDLPDASRWPKLRAIGMTVNRTLRDGKETIEGRYYILSRKLTGKQFAKAVRDHWSIENSLPAFCIIRATGCDLRRRPGANPKRPRSRQLQSASSAGIEPAEERTDIESRNQKQTTLSSTQRRLSAQSAVCSMI
ncbi:MAG: ISAs1 family transposase, partial [Rhodopirellula sp.]|nr:ISAs1 family transposase [Rhodopirellula sp.]